MKKFTLVELLVVICIIAILAALLYPAVLKAKTHARASKANVSWEEISKCVNDARMRQEYISSSEALDRIIKKRNEPKEPKQFVPVAVENPFEKPRKNKEANAEVKTPKSININNLVIKDNKIVSMTFTDKNGQQYNYKEGDK